MAELKDWNVAAASNNSAPPDGWPENMAYSAVNNTAREGMAVIARWFKDNNGSLTSAGSANAYTLTPNGTYSAYFTGMTFRFKASFANTGACTLNVSALGAKNIYSPSGAALASGAIPINSMVTVVYDGTQFILASILYVASSSIDHDATTNFVADEHVAHSGVTLTAGAGLTGGGTIASNRSFAVDFDGQTEIDSATLAASDLLLVYDADAAAFKKVRLRGAGGRIVAASTKTLDLNDGNSSHSNTGATTYTVTVPPNSSVSFPVGTFVTFGCTSTGKITLAAGVGVTIASLDSLLTVKASGGFALLYKVATDTWLLVGTLE